MTQMTRAALIAAISMLGMMMTPLDATAQGMFAPVVSVDDRVITRYEIDQRVALLRVFRTPGDVAALAREQLIEDRVKMAEARARGITISDEAVMQGMTEFAARADLSREAFLRAIGGAGVSEESFRDFIVAQLGWRDLVRARFNARVRITDAEIDKALATPTGGSAVRVLLSEIIIPAPPQQEAEALAVAERISQISSIAAFSAEAGNVSATQSRTNGGRLDWMPLTNLPAPLRPVIMGLSVGEVTQPIPLEGAIALFQLRAIEETSAQTPEIASVDYARYFLPGGRTEDNLNAFAQLRARVDACDDLYGIAKGQPAEVLQRQQSAPADLPGDVALELAKLDRNEMSANLTRTATDGSEMLMVLMLCGRTAAGMADVGRDQIAAQLRNQRLEGHARIYLAELIADARIVDR